MQQINQGDSQDYVRRMEVVARDIMELALNCGSHNVVRALMSDLYLFSPRLALRAQQLGAAKKSAELFYGLFGYKPVQGRGSDASICSIAAGGPILWRAVHMMAHSRRLVVYDDRAVRPWFVFMMHLPDYFPLGCPCRENYEEEKPALVALMRKNPQARPADLLRASVRLHARVNVKLGKPPLPPGETEETMMAQYYF